MRRNGPKENKEYSNTISSPNPAIMQVSASIQSSYNYQQVIVSTNDIPKELPIAPKASGYGSSINGGELLMLALATCYCNNLYREATKKSLIIKGLEVVCSGIFSAEGEAGSDFSYQVKVLSDASQEEIEDFLKHTDSVAEIHNSIRKGLEVKLVL
jgi:uncharacterized OsmC-like protein